MKFPPPDETTTNDYRILYEYSQELEKQLHALKDRYQTEVTELNQTIIDLAKKFAGVR